MSFVLALFGALYQAQCRSVPVSRGRIRRADLGRTVGEARGAPELPERPLRRDVYAWRLCYSYLSVAVAPPPKVGSPEWHQQEEQEMLQAAVAQYQAERKRKRTRTHWECRSTSTIWQSG